MPPALRTMKPPFPIPPNGTVVTVGTFDGIHLGHRAVLQEISRRAAGNTTFTSNSASC